MFLIGEYVTVLGLRGLWEVLAFIEDQQRYILVSESGDSMLAPAEIIGPTGRTSAREALNAAITAMGS